MRQLERTDSACQSHRKGNWGNQVGLWATQQPWQPTLDLPQLMSGFEVPTPKKRKQTLVLRSSIFVLMLALLRMIGSLYFYCLLNKCGAAQSLRSHKKDVGLKRKKKFKEKNIIKLNWIIGRWKAVGELVWGVSNLPLELKFLKSRINGEQIH